MSIQLFCGEALCKKPVTLPPGPAAWPLSCPACRTPLYPRDVLEKLPDREIQSKPAALMIVRGGARVAVTSAEIDAAAPRSAAAVAPPRAAATDPAAEADRLLAMVDLEPRTPAPGGGMIPAERTPARATRGPALLLGAAVLVLVIVLAVLASR